MFRRSPFTFRDVSLTFRRDSLTFRSVPIAFRRVHLSFRNVPITFRKDWLTYPSVPVTFRKDWLTYPNVPVTIRKDRDMIRRVRLTFRWSWVAFHGEALAQEHPRGAKLKQTLSLTDVPFTISQDPLADAIRTCAQLLAASAEHARILTTSERWLSQRWCHPGSG